MVASLASPPPYLLVLLYYLTYPSPLQDPWLSGGQGELRHLLSSSPLLPPPRLSGSGGKVPLALQPTARNSREDVFDVRRISDADLALRRSSAAQ